MKKFLLLLLALPFFSCDVDIYLDDPNCGTATLDLVNESTHPYNIYLDEVYLFTMEGQSFNSIQLEEGNYKLMAEQVSGYLFYPTIREKAIWLEDCDYLEWVFPFSNR